ncbi:MAG: hypothetical protein QF614_05620 [SAR324 cluster bacterium]|jgi:hypothetical protein|nr:hypothetical protein [SAR324 cluster bacterium]
MTLTEKLIELINVKPITEDDLAATAWSVLDGLANTVAGTNSPQGRILTEWFRICDRPTPETFYDAKFSLQHCTRSPCG